MKKPLVVLLFVITAVLTGCGGGMGSAELKPNYSRPPFIIDSHMHYEATDEWEESFLKIYGENNAMACLLMPMEDLERGIAFAKAHPDRVIPYAEIDINSPTVTDDIMRVKAMGFRGLGELFATGRWDYNDPRYDTIWALAEKLGMPVAPHTGNLSNGMMAHLRPSFLADVAATHPDLFIHAAHFGNPWYEEAAEAARRNRNLYFDLSGSSLIKKENDPHFWAQWLWWTDAIGKPHMPKDAVPAWEKILFATDEGPEALIENIRRFNKALDACGVDEATREKCYGLTMAKVFGIEIPGNK
ncbi:MAG: amidohydrolase family protein [Bacteroidales bacterium]|nr:amidohydrolase family protein [Bacteroidales bacterium]